MSFNSIYFCDLTCFKTFDLKLNSYSFHSAATNYITPNHSYEWKLIKNVISVKLDSCGVHMDIFCDVCGVRRCSALLWGII